MSLIRAQRASLIVLNSEVHQEERVLSRIKQHFRRYRFEVRLFRIEGVGGPQSTGLARSGVDCQ